jgi:hypothetical protein
MHFRTYSLSFFQPQEAGRDACRWTFNHWRPGVMSFILSLFDESFDCPVPFDICGPLMLVMLAALSAELLILSMGPRQRQMQQGELTERCFIDLSIEAGVKEESTCDRPTFCPADMENQTETPKSRWTFCSFALCLNILWWASAAIIGIEIYLFAFSLVDKTMLFSFILLMVSVSAYHMLNESFSLSESSLTAPSSSSSSRVSCICGGDQKPRGAALSFYSEK